jgi:hypothetical protein
MNGCGDLTINYLTRALHGVNQSTYKRSETTANTVNEKHHKSSKQIISLERLVCIRE